VTIVVCEYTHILLLTRVAADYLAFPALAILVAVVAILQCIARSSRYAKSKSAKPLLLPSSQGWQQIESPISRSAPFSPSRKGSMASVDAEKLEHPQSAVSHLQWTRRSSNENLFNERHYDQDSRPLTTLPVMQRVYSPSPHMPLYLPSSRTPTPSLPHPYMPVQHSPMRVSSPRTPMISSHTRVCPEHGMSSYSRASSPAYLGRGAITPLDLKDSVYIDQSRVFQTLPYEQQDHPRRSSRHETPKHSHPSSYRDDADMHLWPRPGPGEQQSMTRARASMNEQLLQKQVGRLSIGNRNLPTGISERRRWERCAT
jgi:hypothetical protein